MTSEKRIHRAKHDKENPYYIASRDTAQDKAISYDALGMLNYVLSKPDDWIIQPSDLIREKCALGKVYTILKELITSKYVERIYHRDDKKRVVMVEYIAHEKPLIEKLLSEKPKVAKPKVEKRNSIKYRNKQQSTEKKQKKENTRKRSHPLFPMKFPSNVRAYTGEHIAAYNKEHATDLTALIHAWAGEMYNSLTEFTNKVAYLYIETYQELSRLNIPCSDYPALVKQTKLKQSWKSNLVVTDVLLHVTDYKPAPAKVYDDPAMDLNIPQATTPILLQRKEEVKP